MTFPPVSVAQFLFRARSVSAEAIAMTHNFVILSISCEGSSRRKPPGKKFTLQNQQRGRLFSLTNFEREKTTTTEFKKVR